MRSLVSIDSVLLPSIPSLLCTIQFRNKHVGKTRTYTFHFARKVLQTMPMLTLPSTKSDPPATHLQLSKAGHGRTIYRSDTRLPCKLMTPKAPKLSTKTNFVAETIAGFNIIEQFDRMPVGDLWHDACVVEAVYYARGSKALRIPSQEWRRVLPTDL